MASLKDNLMQQLSSFVHQRLLAVAQEMLGQVERALALALDGGERPQSCTASAASEADRTFTDPAHPVPGPAATQSHYSPKEELVLRITADQSNDTLDCTLGEMKEEEEMYAIEEPEGFMAPLSDDGDDDDDDVEPSRDLKNNESEQAAIIEERKVTQSGEKPFHCDVCGKRFKSTCSLTTHKHIHTGDKLHHCEVCEKSFTIRGNLENHMRVHTGEKPFSCDICGKGFRVKWNLSAHVRTHTGERPFHCDVCGKAFTNSSGLTNHKRSHTGERPYSCVACGKTFSRSGHLSRHVHCCGDLPSPLPSPFGCRPPRLRPGGTNWQSGAHTWTVQNDSHSLHCHAPGAAQHHGRSTGKLLKDSKSTQNAERERTHF